MQKKCPFLVIESCFGAQFLHRHICGIRSEDKRLCSLVFLDEYRNCIAYKKNRDLYFERHVVKSIEAEKEEVEING